MSFLFTSNVCVVIEFMTRDTRRQWLMVHGAAHSFWRSNNCHVGHESSGEDSRQTTKRLHGIVAM